MSDKTKERFQFGYYDFDVDKGIEIAGNREPMMVDPREAILPWTNIDNAYAATTDPTQPGLLATLFLSGSYQMVLVDGHHRAKRAMDLGQKFPARALTFEETISILAPNIPVSGMKRDERKARARRK